MKSNKKQVAFSTPNSNTIKRRSPTHENNANNYGMNSAYHFSSSASFNSPDPSLLPMPIFDDFDHSEFIVEQQVSQKTRALRDFLNIKTAQFV